MQQKPDEAVEIFAYFCHAPVPPQVIIELAWYHQKKKAIKIISTRLEKELKEKKLHLIHGHTEDDVERATNLDTPWEKFFTDENKIGWAGEYLASVHHTGAHQATEIKQTYFKYQANLKRHPSKEKEIQANEKLDQDLLGIQPMGENDTLELGDMHANALRLIYHLIKHGIFQVAEQDHEKMVELYGEIDGLFKGNEELKKTAIIEKHEKFKTLIDCIQINNITIKLKLIGDLLVDRGVSDILMEWLIIKLDEASNIDLTILASNHDQAYFTKPGTKRNSALPATHKQRQSLDRAVQLRDTDHDPANIAAEYNFPQPTDSITADLRSLVPVQLALKKINDSLLEKIVSSPLTWTLLSISAAAYPIYDCVQSDKVDSLSTALNHLIHHGALTPTLSAAAFYFLLLSLGVALHAVCSKNPTPSRTPP